MGRFSGQLFSGEVFSSDRVSKVSSQSGWADALYVQLLGDMRVGGKQDKSNLS
jgi:hypothetical protein